MNRLWGTLYLVVLVLALSCQQQSQSAEKGVLVSAARGGSIASADGALVIEFPGGAFDSDSTVTITLADASTLPDHLRDRVIGTGYHVDTGDAALRQPASLRLRIGADDMPKDAGITLARLTDDGIVELLGLASAEVASDGSIQLVGETLGFSRIYVMRDVALAVHGTFAHDPAYQVGAKFEGYLGIRMWSDSETEITIRGLEKTAAGKVKAVEGGWKPLQGVGITLEPPERSTSSDWHTNLPYACDTTPGSGDLRVILVYELRQLSPGPHYRSMRLVKPPPESRAPGRLQKLVPDANFPLGATFFFSKVECTQNAPKPEAPLPPPPQHRTDQLTRGVKLTPDEFKAESQLPRDPIQVLAFVLDGIAYDPTGLRVEPKHPPFCDYDHVHGPSIKSLKRNLDGTFTIRSEHLAECGYGVPNFWVLITSDIR